MSGIHLVLLGVGAFGFLPLIIILYKQARVKKILTIGMPAKATVYGVHTAHRRLTDLVQYSFHAQNTSQQYTGTFTIKSGTYKRGDVLDIYYMPGNPKRNTMQGAWSSPFMVIFGIIIAAFVLFAVYKMYEMVESGSM